MIIIYILLSCLIGYSYKKTNLLFSFILGILSLTLLMNNFSIISSSEVIFSTIVDILNNQFFIYLFIFIILIFITFDLFSLYNYNYPIEEAIENQSISNKKIILTLLSFFSTNIDFTNSRLDVAGKTNFKLNSILLPFINISSIPFIYIFMIFSFLLVNKISDITIIIGLLLNLFVVLWFIINIVLFFIKKNYHYSINNDLYNDIIPNVPIKKINKKPIKIEKKHSRIMIICFLITEIISFFAIDTFNIMLFLVIAAAYALMFFIYQGENLSYRHKFLDEKEIFSTIYSSALSFLFEIFEIILGVLLAIQIYQFIDILNINLALLPTLLFTTIFMIVLFMLFNNYKLIASVTIPILALYINNMNQLTDNLTFIVLIISSYVTLLAFFQFFSVLTFKALDKLKIKIIIFLFIISITYLILLLLNSAILYSLFVIIIFFGLLLFIIISVRQKQ